MHMLQPAAAVFLPFYILYLKIAFKHLEGVINAVFMTALIAVACIYARTYKSMANIMPCAKRRFNVGAVMRINVYGVIGIFFFGGFNKLSYNVVAVRSA